MQEMPSRFKDRQKREPPLPPDEPEPEPVKEPPEKPVTTPDAPVDEPNLDPPRRVFCGESISIRLEEALPLSGLTNIARFEAERALR